jgi:hypothetical protein
MITKMQKRVQTILPLIAILTSIVGCGGIESRQSPAQYTPTQQTPALPAVEGPAWNSIDIIFLKTEIVHVDAAPHRQNSGDMSAIQNAGVGA